MPSFSSLRRRLVLIAGEAIWLSLILSAIANTWPRFSMSVPLWPMLISGECALLVATSINSIAKNWQRRLPLATLASAILILLGAGLLGSASPGISFLHTAFLPFGAPRGRISSITTLAWLDTLVIVIRAGVVAFTKDTFARSIRSVVVASIAYFGLFLTMATQHSARLVSATRGIEPLFLLYFLTAIILLRLSRASDIEAGAVVEMSASEGLSWRLLLLAPLLLVGFVALLITAALGSKSSSLHRAIASIGHAILWFFRAIWNGFSYLITHIALGIVDAISFIVNLFVHRHPEGAITRITHQASQAATKGSTKAPIGLTVGLMVAFLIGGVIGIALLARNRRPKVIDMGQRGGDIRSSTFSWRVLFAQLCSGIATLLRTIVGKLRRPRDSAATAPSRLAPEGVRRDLQRLLRAARAQGVGRQPGETASEFLQSLGRHLDTPDASAILARLDARYNAARYGRGEQTAELTELVLALIEELERTGRRTGAPPTLTLV